MKFFFQMKNDEKTYNLNISLLFLIAAFYINISSQVVNNQSWRYLAQIMVEDQIVNRGVSSKEVIEIMKNTPRHVFVLPEYINESYNDYPLPIDEGQTISQPYIVALMTELLDVKKQDKVLEIGTGSGYQLAVLAQLSEHCYSIEIKEYLAIKSSRLLDSLGYDNVKIKYGDGYNGWKEHAPYDKIIITAAPPEIPQELINQLNEGGKMVLPVGEDDQELIVLEKKGDNIYKSNIIPVRFVPMIHEKIIQK